MHRFIADRGVVADRAVSAAEVVPALDEGEQLTSSLLVRLETRAGQQFAFERGEEALAHGVVEAIAHCAHRGAYSRFTAASAEGKRGVLTSLIRVVDDAPGATLYEGHVERTQHQLRVQMIGHRPAHNAATEDIEHDGEIEKAFCGRHVGGIGHPQPVRGVGHEVPLHEIGRGPRAALPPRRVDPAPPAHAAQTRNMHQTGNTFASDMHAVLDQLRMDAGHAVRAARACMNGSNTPEQIGVATRSFRWAARQPRVIAAGRNSQQSRHRRNGQCGLVRFHEFEPFSGTVPVSRANQAAAFERISRSSSS